MKKDLQADLTALDLEFGPGIATLNIQNLGSRTITTGNPSLHAYAYALDIRAGGGSFTHLSVA